VSVDVMIHLEPTEYHNWTGVQCAEFVARVVQLPQYAQAAKVNFTGRNFFHLEQSHLASAGVRDFDHQKKIVRFVRMLRSVDGQERLRKLVAGIDWTDAEEEGGPHNFVLQAKRAVAMAASKGPLCEAILVPSVSILHSHVNLEADPHSSEKNLPKPPFFRDAPVHVQSPPSPAANAADAEPRQVNYGTKILKHRFADPGLDAPDDAQASAATSIQKMHRAKMARKEAHRRRSQKEVEEAAAEMGDLGADGEVAATKLQSHFRGSRARKQSERKKKEVARTDGEILVEQMGTEGDGAATKLQSRYRGNKARRETQQKKEEAAAAVKVQSTFRGKKARAEVAEKRAQQK